VLIDDCPWWRERMKDGPVALLHESVSPEIARRCQLKGVALTLQEVLVVQPMEIRDAELATFCRRFEEQIRAPAFEDGLRRLVYMEHQRMGGEVSVVLDLHFVPSGPIRTALTNSPLSPHDQFGEDDVEIFLDGPRVFISSTAADVSLVAEAVNRRLGMNRLVNLAPLEEILRLGPNQIERALNRRKVPTVPSVVPTAMPRWEDPASDPLEFGEHLASHDDDELERQRQTSQWWSTRRLVSSEVGPSDGDHEYTRGSDEQAEFAEPMGQAGYPEGFQADRTSRTPKEGWAPRSQPSSRPGDGSTMEWAPREGARLRSYLAPPFAREEPRNVGDMMLERELVDAAIEHARRYEENRVGAGNVDIVSRAEYDMVTLNASGAPERIIKVKGLATAWSIRGVGLDARQAAAAREYGDNFWLYVVEYATDSDRARVFAIFNPVRRTTEFLFDGGWRTLAETASTVVEPAVGLHLRMGEAYLGMIEAVEVLPSTVEGEAPMLRLRLRSPEGELQRITYSPSRHVVTREQ
jgi:hypothetical protein